MQSDTQPNLIQRILHFPFIRLPLLGGVLFLLIGISNGFRYQYAATPLMALALIAGMVALGLTIYCAFIYFVERRTVSELALPHLGRELGVGLLLGLGLYSLAIAILMLIGVYRIEGINPWVYLLPMLSMALSSGVLEELIYRGVLYRVLEEYLGSWIALALSSLVFGLGHFLNPDGTLLGAIFITIEAGVLLAACFMLTRRLWIGIGLHMSWNYAQAAIFSGAVSGNEMPPGLLITSISGPDLLTGGKFGVESSVAAFAVCTLAGLIVLMLAVRRGNVLPPIWARSAAANS